MSLRWMLAALHLLALGIGLGAVWCRARALDGPLDRNGLRRVFYADTWWGVAALLWIGTGAARAFGSLEKGTQYYLHNDLFLAKMGMLLVILLLEIRPMISLARWRMLTAQGSEVNTQRARGFARVSYLQVILVLAMVVAATGMARGYGTGR